MTSYETARAPVRPRHLQSRSEIRRIVFPSRLSVIPLGTTLLVAHVGRFATVGVLGAAFGDPAGEHAFSPQGSQGSTGNARAIVRAGMLRHSSTEE